MPLLPRSKTARFGLATVAAVLLVIGWYLASPLFIDRQVDEGFPDTMADADLLDRVVVEGMPVEAMPAALAEGRFTDADAIHKGSGTARLYRLPDGRNIVRFEDFRVTNGPDLYVWITAAGPGADSDAVKAANSIELAQLKGNVGAQNYELPGDIDPADYPSVVIWCRAFGVLFSQAVLEPTA